MVKHFLYFLFLFNFNSLFCQNIWLSPSILQSKSVINSNVTNLIYDTHAKITDTILKLDSSKASGKYVLNKKWLFNFYEKTPKSIAKIEKNTANKWKLKNLPIYWDSKTLLKKSTELDSTEIVTCTENIIYCMKNMDISPTGVLKKKLYIKNLTAFSNYFIEISNYNSSITLYINGRRVGYAECYSQKSVFLISPYLTEGENSIIITVQNWSKQTLLSKNTDLYGGIFGDISLLKIPKVYFSDIDINAKLIKNNQGQLEVKTSIKNDFQTKINSLILECIVMDGKDTILSTKKVKNNFFDGNKQKDVYFYENVKNIKKWDFKNPKLYDLTLKLIDLDHSNLVETHTQKIGFRNIEIKDNFVFLNQKKINVNLVDIESIINLKTSSLKEIEKMLAKYKNQNITFIRVQDQMNVKRIYSLCDKIGLGIISDLNYHIHENEVAEIINTSKWEKVFNEKLESFLGNYKNYTSNLLWSMGKSYINGWIFSNLYEKIKNTDFQKRGVIGDFDKNKTLINQDLAILHYKDLDILKTNKQTPIILGPFDVSDVKDILKFKNFINTDEYAGYYFSTPKNYKQSFFVFNNLNLPKQSGYYYKITPYIPELGVIKFENKGISDLNKVSFSWKIYKNGKLNKNGYIFSDKIISKESKLFFMKPPLYKQSDIIKIHYTISTDGNEITSQNYTLHSEYSSLDTASNIFNIPYIVEKFPKIKVKLINDKFNINTITGQIENYKNTLANKKINIKICVAQFFEEDNSNFIKDLQVMFFKKGFNKENETYYEFHLPIEKKHEEKNIDSIPFLKNIYTFKKSGELDIYSEIYNDNNNKYKVFHKYKLYSKIDSIEWLGNGPNKLISELNNPNDIQLNSQAMRFDSINKQTNLNEVFRNTFWLKSFYKNKPIYFRLDALKKPFGYDVSLNNKRQSIIVLPNNSKTKYLHSIPSFYKIDTDKTPLQAQPNLFTYKLNYNLRDKYSYTLQNKAIKVLSDKYFLQKFMGIDSNSTSWKEQIIYKSNPRKRKKNTQKTRDSLYNFIYAQLNKINGRIAGNNIPKTIAPIPNSKTDSITQIIQSNLISENNKLQIYIDSTDIADIIHPDPLELQALAEIKNKKKRARIAKLKSGKPQKKKSIFATQNDRLTKKQSDSLILVRKKLLKKKKMARMFFIEQPKKIEMKPNK